MPPVISNTSPLLYLYRIDVIEWLHRLFGEVWTPPAVQMELQVGREKGYDVPELTDYTWLHIVSPESVPSEWLTSDLGRGELETIALALEYPKHIVVLDDGLARKIAKAANLDVWGTLRVLLAAKEAGFTERIGPFLKRLESSGMWLSKTVQKRVLKLAGELEPS